MLIVGLSNLDIFLYRQGMADVKNQLCEIL